jgi:phosphatidylglycerophosphatase A
LRIKNTEGKILKLSDSVYKNIATLGPVGYIPKAPGTAGTAAALLLLLLIKPSVPVFVLLMLAATVLGTIASDKAEKSLKDKDSSHIVIDEVAGYFFAMAFLPQTVGYLIAAFTLFRIFDILKPGPIRKLQYLSGGAGVMADDIAAGIAANVILQLWRILI